MGSVLIVDDDARIQELLLRWLKPAGHTLRFAEDANAALLAIGGERPEVIVLDVHMPGANGLWLADRVRAMAPATAIVLATGDKAIPPIESLRRAVVAYLLKPLRREEVLEAVAAGIAWSRAAMRQRPALSAVAPRQLPASRP